MTPGRGRGPRAAPRSGRVVVLSGGMTLVLAVAGVVEGQSDEGVGSQTGSPARPGHGKPPSGDVPFPLPAEIPDAPRVPAESPGERASPTELSAWRLANERKYIEAREAAEAILEREPSSYVAELVLGLVQHYGEGNFPRALFHLERAMQKYEAFHGAAPAATDPFLWHGRLLDELATVHGDLEHHAEKLAYLARHDALYDPDRLAERAWPLMKLGRFAEARAAAQLGLAENRPIQTLLGLNALCAIEFEAGNDGASYEACRRAVDHARETQGRPSTVDLTNFAEASRSLFRLDEAERVLLEATEANVSWYGNPWLELATLYLRAARFPEALDALRKVKGYRARRPPHVQDADLNEVRREHAAFFLAVGRARAALDITERALVLPDRRGYNSRDPAQDEALVALLDRRARLVAAERRREKASVRPWWTWPGAWLESASLRVEAWMSGRRAARLLADEDRLVGTFRIGTAKGAIMPPWLAGELVDVLGAGVVDAAIRRARARDEREGSDAYYDAFAAEAALRTGRLDDCLTLAAKATAALGPGEAMLRARLDALVAAALARRGEDASKVTRAFEAAWTTDPGVLRRLGMRVPASVTHTGGRVAEATAALLGWSPRIRQGGGGLTIRVEADGLGGRACVVGASGAVLACGEAQAEENESTATIAEKLADAFHAAAFAPQIDLTQADVSSLDGVTTGGDGAIDQLLEGAPE